MSLVQSFNALPRNRKAPSGRVSNEWHFDIRYVHIEPTPAHVLAIIQPQSQLLHMERLPIGLPVDVSGIEFFPESAKDAAPAVAKALLHVFNIGLNSLPPFAPWRLTTEDQDLADAVGEEFRRLGVRPDDLHKIALSTSSVNKFMQAQFDRIFQTLKKSIGIQDQVSFFITTPTSISFHNSVLPPPPTPPLDSSKLDLCLNYAMELQRSRPPKSEDMDKPSKIPEQIQSILRMVAEKPASVVKAEADSGNPEASFDYGLRLLVGLGCEYDRTLARNYLIKAAFSAKASDELKSAAHSTLISWYVSSATKLTSRYLFAASHHANLAASLSRRVSPNGFPASPAVLWFMSKVFRPFSETVPELCYWFKDAQSALGAREAQLAHEKEKMAVKRLKNPNRYRCATVGCCIETEARKTLKLCSGKCDADKKPSYCSKECQKADWKNHKPFCKPDMPCSVIDSASPGEGILPSVSRRAIHVPVSLPSGSTMHLASSTIDSTFLKEVKDYIEREGQSDSLPENLTIELNKFE